MFYHTLSSVHSGSMDTMSSLPQPSRRLYVKLHVIHSFTVQWTLPVQLTSYMSNVFVHRALWPSRLPTLPSVSLSSLVLPWSWERAWIPWSSLVAVLELEESSSILSLTPLSSLRKLPLPNYEGDSVEIDSVAEVRQSTSWPSHSVCIDRPMASEILNIVPEKKIWWSIVEKWVKKIKATTLKDKDPLPLLRDTLCVNYLEIVETLFPQMIKPLFVLPFWISHEL